ncbi:DUF5711 family protein [Pseudobacteroides cellulosolvens]|uniref:DUF5711 family protein n=1 Tax=Pseudobacteroides cellulosolvens TaxID=35825 RepID=UPI00056679D8|nr:DUF5711 family protein [Pseudobacteroides cellulosolvens]
MKYSEKEKVSNDLHEDQQSSGSFRLRNFIIFAILLLAVIATSLFMYLKSKNVDLENMSLKDIVNELMDISGNKSGNKVVKEIEIGTNEKHVFTVSKGLIIECVKNRVKALNGDGEEQWVVPIYAANPVVKAAGSYVMVADLEGKDVYLLSGKTIKWSKKMEGNIINADVNEAGYVSVVRQEKGYRGAVTVINKNGAQAINTKVAKKFVFMSKVSPSGDTFVINSFDASGIKSDAVIELHDFSEKGGVALETGDTSLFPFVDFLGNGNLAAVGDSNVYLYDNEGKVKWMQKFTNKSFMCGDLLSGDAIVAAMSDMDSSGKITGNKTDITLINDDGEKKTIYSMDIKVKNIKVSSGIIAINTGTSVYYINSKGELLGKFDSKTNISEVHFLSRQKTVLVCKNSLIINNI